MASGNIAGTTSTVRRRPAHRARATAADGRRRQADDVNTAQPEPRAAWASPTAPTRTSTRSPDERRRAGRCRHAATPRARASTSSSATGAWTPTRPSRRRRRAGSRPRPTSPRPNGSSSSTRARPSFAVDGYVDARAASYTCRVEVAPGGAAEQRTERRRRRLRDASPSNVLRRQRPCTRRSAPGPARARSARAHAEGAVPARRPASFTGNENGGTRAELQRAARTRCPTRSRSASSWHRRAARRARR